MLGATCVESLGGRCNAAARVQWDVPRRRSGYGVRYVVRCGAVVTERASEVESRMTRDHHAQWHDVVAGPPKRGRVDGQQRAV